MRSIVGFVSLLLALACGACAKSTAPDPNVAMYGTWSGVLRDTMDTSAGPQPQQFALVLQFGKGGVLPAVDGRTYASAVDFMRDPDVAFEVRSGAQVSGFVGTRTGDTLSGKTGWTSFRRGTWTVVRSPMPWANGGSR
jgi:hypothetical protein